MRGSSQSLQPNWTVWTERQSYLHVSNSRSAIQPILTGIQVTHNLLYQPNQAKLQLGWQEVVIHSTDPQGRMSLSLHGTDACA